MFLVDTNVLSALAPGKPESEALKHWLELRSESLYLSAVTAAEIEDGIATLRREDASKRAADLRQWWDAIEHLYGDRILPFDLTAARCAGIMSDRARSAGHSAGFADIAIAATAQANALTVLTRNAKHFLPLGVQVQDPFRTLTR